MYNVTGYFNENGDAYTLTTPKTRAGYLSCLMNNVGYGFAVNQFGMGDTFCKYKFTAQNNILENGERTVYFRDDDTNDVWCVGGFPYASQIKDFSCTHEPSKTVLSSLHDGIRVTITYFVPTDRRCDVTTVQIINESGRKRCISIIPAYKMLLTGYEAPSWCDNLSQTYKTSFREEINGLHLDGRNPYTDGMPFDAFVSSTTPVHAYSADDRIVFGSQYSLSMPYVLLDGEDLDSRPVVAGKLCMLLQSKCTLKPGDSFTTDYILGVGEDFEEIQTLVADMKSRNDILRIYNKTAAADLARRNRLMIETPDRETNLFMNYWLKLGLEWNILWRRAPRDNIQFAHAGLWYLPDALRYTIAHVMEQQFRNGHLIRRWRPVLTTIYGDGPMWLIASTCDYLKFTGDFAFLEEQIAYFDGGSGTVWEHLLNAIQRVDKDRGTHNLPLSHFADWNDALNTGIRDEQAESVFVAMQLALSFREMAELCAHLKKTDLAQDFAAKYEALKQTINETCWDEKGYYVRSFVNGRVIGSSVCTKGSKIYVNPQSWSIISGVCPEERIQSVLDAIDQYLETPVGCMVNAPAYDEYDPDLGRISFQYPGTSENGAIYAHATTFKMYADCQLGLSDRAYASFKKILPSNPDNPSDVSDTIPYTVSNTCLTAKECFGKSSATPWLTGTMAWLFRTVIEGFFGLRFSYGGLRIRPAMPLPWDKATLTLNHDGTDYTFSYKNTHAGRTRIFINEIESDTDFVAFTKDPAVDIRIEF